MRPVKAGPRVSARLAMPIAFCRVAGRIFMKNIQDAELEIARRRERGAMIKFDARRKTWMKTTRIPRCSKKSPSRSRTW